MRTSLRCVVVLTLVVALPLVIGCGGGDGNPPAPPGGNVITGQVAGAAGANYEVLLDGRAVPGAMRADGSYVIGGVPPGEHRVGVVEAGGLNGGYATVLVPDGQDVEVPEIRPTLGGQIVGIVTVEDEDGLRALAGVQVTAVPADLVVIMRAAADNGTTVSPPPALPEFSAFTEDDGSYRIRAVPEGEYTVTVAQPEYEQGWQWVWVGAGQTAAADFRLRRAVEPGVGTVEGRVMGVTPEGVVPIEGAVVSIYSDTPWEPIGPIMLPGLVDPADDEGSDGGETGGGGEGDEPGGDPAEPPGDIGSMPPPWFYGVTTLTDADGRYSLNAPAGYGSIDVWAPGFDSAWEEIVIEANQTLTKNFRLQQWQREEMRPPEPEPVPVPGER